MNLKTSKLELLKSIENEIVIYLQSGKLNINPYITDLNLNIDSIDDLVKIHFMLDENVKEYIYNLNEYMKKFNLSTIYQEESMRCKIRGQVCWGKTFQLRNNINLLDNTIFVCNNKNKNYNTKENIVLKELLIILKELYNSELVEEFDKFSWFTDNIGLRERVNGIVEKNIYLSRIKRSRKRVDKRTIEEVLKSRNILYRRSAELLKYYYKAIDLDKNVLLGLFRNTFIDIADDSTLFELYWILKIIKDNSTDATLSILKEGNNKIAEWKKNKSIYSIYHNSKGSSEIDFYVSLDEIRGMDNPYIKRKIRILEQTNDIANELFDDNINLSNCLFNGRPDIIIGVKNEESDILKKIYIGEVKYTTKQDYAIQGLKELLEYINYIKIRKGKYQFEYVDNDLNIVGMLFLDNIRINKSNVSNINVITINEKNIKINIE